MTYGIKFTIDILNLTLPESIWSSPDPLRLSGDLYQARERFIIEDGGFKNALLMNNGMLQANGPLWSLCIEWRIYLVAGAVAMTLSCKNYFAKIILAIITIITFIKLRKVNDQYAFFTCVWLIGSAISLYKFRYKNLAIPRFVRVVMIVAITASLAYPEYLLGTVTNKTADGFAFQLLLCIAWVCFIFPLEPKLITRVSALLMKLGECSYTLFIIHFPIMLGILAVSIKITGHNLITAIIMSILSAAISLLVSHHAAKYVENKVAVTPYVQRLLSSFITFLFDIKNKYYKSK